MSGGLQKSMIWEKYLFLKDLKKSGDDLKTDTVKAHQNCYHTQLFHLWVFRFFCVVWEKVLFRVYSCLKFGKNVNYMMLHIKSTEKV